MQQGRLVPAKMAAGRQPELAKAVTKAPEKARQLGLIADEARE